MNLIRAPVLTYRCNTSRIGRRLIPTVRFNKARSNNCSAISNIFPVATALRIEYRIVTLFRVIIYTRYIGISIHITYASPDFSARMHDTVE